MRLARRHRPATSRMNMTPMIDVTFLLLIFFMTVSQVSEVNREPIELPKQQGAEDQQPSELIINVTEEGQAIISGNAVTLPQVVAIVGEQISRAGGDPNQVNVVIRADQRGASRTVNEIVEALNELQVRRVRIAVQVPQ